MAGPLALCPASLWHPWAGGLCAGFLLSQLQMAADPKLGYYISDFPPPQPLGSLARFESSRNLFQHKYTIISGSSRDRMGRVILWVSLRLEGFGAKPSLFRAAGQPRRLRAGEMSLEIQVWWLLTVNDINSQN